MFKSYDGVIAKILRINAQEKNVLSFFTHGQKTEIVMWMFQKMFI